MIERSGDVWALAVRYTSKATARKALASVNAAIIQSGVRLSAYRFLVPDVDEYWYVAVVGDVPSPFTRERISATFALTLGEAVTLSNEHYRELIARHFPERYQLEITGRRHL